MENNSGEINTIDDNIFEQINRSLLDLKDNPGDNTRIVELLGQVIQMNKSLHNRLGEFSTILSTHASHLDSHDQHLEAHDTHLQALTQRVELLNRS